MEQSVETVDGMAEVEVPPLSRSGQKVLIRGRGAKICDSSLGKRGDHIITLRVSDMALQQKMGLLCRR